MPLLSRALLPPLLLAITACAPLVQYRTDYALCATPAPRTASDCAASALQLVPAGDGAEYTLGFIEFDDQGQLWDRRQMAAVLDHLTTRAADDDQLIVVFVHGWKHNAAPGDSNIDTFRSVLARLSRDEALVARQLGKPARRVSGVYLGWRGGSVPVRWIENLTFWDRKSTAQKVGHGGVTEVLARLEQLKRDKESTGSTGTRLVVVGHSFGGAIVHTALVQVLEGRFVRGRGPDGVQTDVEGFGNLVVLINPAFEANLFTPLADMAAARGNYFPSQLPVVAVLTSEADAATRYAFPVGRRLSTLFEKTRDTTHWNATTRRDETVSEDETNVTALGHFAPYRTHRLYPAQDVPRSAVAPMASADSLRSALQAAQQWKGDQPGSKIAFGDLMLERTAESAGRNPYLLVHVDRQLIHDHNDIDDERVIEFLRQLVLVSTLPEGSKAAMRQLLQVPGR